MSLSHQDWEPVVLINHKLIKEKQKKDPKNKVVRTKRKKTITGKKLNADDELPKQKTVGHELGMKMQKARIAKKLKQVDVARRLNMQASLYQKYENGTAPRNGSMLNKIGKILGVKLTGKGV